MNFIENKNYLASTIFLSGFVGFATPWLPLLYLAKSTERKTLLIEMTLCIVFFIVSLALIPFLPIYFLKPYFFSLIAYLEGNEDFWFYQNFKTFITKLRAKICQSWNEVYDYSNNLTLTQVEKLIRFSWYTEYFGLFLTILFAGLAIKYSSDETFSKVSGSFSVVSGTVGLVSKISEKHFLEPKKEELERLPFASLF